MRKEFKAIAILAGIAVLLEGCSMMKTSHEEFGVINKATACEKTKAEGAIGEESHPHIELDDIMEIPLEVGARVIVEYPDGNVYEFFGEEFDVTDNSITVFFEKEVFDAL